ncbi:MAG: DUF1294 domain-containing protein [Cellvibrionaceae bacterium]
MVGTLVFFRLIFSPIFSKWFTHGLLITIACSVIISVVIIKTKLLLNVELTIGIIYGFLLSLNVVTLPLLYCLDKKKSVIEGKERIPESVLHSLAFIGGAIGAIVSQRLFRHKTRKRNFQILTIIALLVSLQIYYSVIFQLKDYL